MENQKTSRLLDLLNSLMAPERVWRKQRAKKKHIDMFGRSIEHSDYHFFRRSADSFSAYQRLSEQSMNIFLECIFEGNPKLQEELETRLSKQQKDFVEKVKELHLR